MFGGINMTDKKELKEGIKYDQEKLSYNLLSPAALRGLVKVLDFGARKYQPYNWMKGIKFSRVYGATLRHLTDDWWDGQDIDKETGLNHVYHALCNLMFLAHYISYPEKYEEFDDRPHKLLAPKEVYTAPDPSPEEMKFYQKILDAIQKDLKRLYEE